MILHRPHTAPVHALAFSPDGDTLAVGEARQVQLLDWRTGVVTGTMPILYSTSLPWGLTFDDAGPVWYDVVTPVAGASEWGWDCLHFQFAARWEFRLILWERAGMRVAGEFFSSTIRGDGPEPIIRAAWADPAGRLAVWCVRTLLSFDPPAAPAPPPRTWLRRIRAAINPPSVELPQLAAAAVHTAPLVPQAVAAAGRRDGAAGRPRHRPPVAPDHRVHRPVAVAGGAMGECSGRQPGRAGGRRRRPPWPGARVRPGLTGEPRPRQEPGA